MPEVRTIAWFHCFSGVAGDMALGALVDAGADLTAVETICRRLDLPGWELTAEPVLRSGVAATKVRVRYPAEHHHRTWSTIRAVFGDADLPPRVHERAVAVFSALARAEGALHRLPPDDVHFHEVGSVDAIVDVVGVCAALEVLGVDEVRCSPIAVGLGTIQAAHGSLPNPAPAVVRLLAAAGAPTHGLATSIELTTPTGAALMAGLADGYGPLPAMAIHATGFGAGGSDPDGVVNATQVVLGTSLAAAAGPLGPGGQPVVLLEVNLDDVTGEVLADAVGTVLTAGAHDAWITPILMKKGRPAHTVSALADPALAPQVAAALRTATGSLGVRGTTYERWPAPRSATTVAVDGHALRVKVSPGRVKVEHDDVVAVAAATGSPVIEVAARAEAAWWSARSAGTDLVEEGPAPPG